MVALPTWWDRVDQVMRNAGVPTRVWTAIAFPESSFVPWASNPNDPGGGSYGLFALNLSGQGSGASKQALMDPVNNAMIAAPYIGAAVRKCGADNIECVAINSGHPVQTGVMPSDQTLVKNIARYYAAAAGKSAQEIYDAFTSGHGIPDQPPGNGGGITGSLGSQIAQGFLSTIGNATRAWIGAGVKIFILQHTDGIMGTTGVLLIVFGIIIAAAKSPVGQAVASVASPAAGAALGAAAGTMSSRGVTRPASAPPDITTVPSVARSVRSGRSPRALRSGRA